MKLTIQAIDKPEEIYLSLRGNLDASTANFLRDTFRTWARKVAGKRMVLDLEQVPFVDSTGLAALVSGLRIVQLNRGSLALTNVQDDVMRIFEITCLDRTFEFLDDYSEHKLAEASTLTNTDRATWEG
jgi:anti-sigma B factor antagonist